MFNSAEEFVMDFKAEEKRAQLPVFDIEDIGSDCTTLSASEDESDRRNNATPPLIWELKKVRVLMKKLPRHVLKRHNIKRKKIPISELHPSRWSGRLKNKQAPLGKYLALHVNKPLHEILTKEKKRIELQQIKDAENERSEKHRNLNNNKKSIPFEHKLKSPNNRKTAISSIIDTLKINVNAERKLREKILATRLKEKPIIPTLISPADVNLISSRPFSLNILNQPVTTTLPNCPDVVVTRYNIPSSSVSNSRNPFILNATVPTALVNNYIKNSITVSKPQHYVHGSASLPFLSANYSHSKNIQSHNVFPPLITPAGNRGQMPRQPMVLNTATTTTSVGIRRQSSSAPRTFTIQAFKVPPKLSASNTLNAPKVLIIKQPSLGTDPLDMSNDKTNSTALEKRGVPEPEPKQIHKDNYSDNNNVVCVESESDSELSDSGKRKEPEVIKRIIYNTKSVQTKFTCNGSICGLVDSDEFNFNCFYCYDIFPLHKWYEFKEHIKLVHHVEEKENQSDLNEDVSNCISHKGHQPNPQEIINATKTIKPIPKLTRKKDCTLTKGVINTEKTFKKLPLEPRLVTQRANKTHIHPIKIYSTPTIPYPSINQSGVSRQSSGRKLPNEINNICTDKIIRLDSDNCDAVVGRSNDITKTVVKTLQLDKNITNKQSYLKKRISGINDVKLIVPSLPDITITKVNPALPKESMNRKPIVEPLHTKKSFIKLDSTLSIKQMMENLPKPTVEELSANACKKARYFIVKKIIKLPKGQTIPSKDTSQGHIPTKKQESEKSCSSQKDYDDMPSNDENEDSVPKPTRGYGILFGVTNSMVVIEFLLKLKTFPELWKSQFINTSSSNYNECVKKLCFHVNSRFELNLTEIETHRSVQRVKDWYYRILKNISEHNKNPNNTEPYKHKFQIYFKILESFLTSDIQDTNAVLNNSQFKSNTNIKANEIACKTGTLPPVGDIKASEPTRVSPTTTLFTSKNIDENKDKSADSLIEFDADTLYGSEISGEEVLDDISNKQIVDSDQKKKRTKDNVGIFECDMCRKIFKRRCDLKRHKVSHYPPQFECDQCSQKFYFKNLAEKCSHIRNINFLMPKRIWPKKVFGSKLICEICGASYRSIGSLNTHKRDKHLNQRDKCVVCNFTALSNWRIVQHQKKRHIVEPGTVEEIAKKCRPRTDTKTRFSNEARQEFDWRREMRKKLKPGEIFYGCCKCRITFDSRKEKVLHNKTEHPITEFTVICLLCLPQKKLLLSNSNCARKHYTDVHKVAWHEIDGLVKRTKPIFKLLSKEEIELLKASANYRDLLEELLKDKNLEPAQNVQTLEDETLKAVRNLPTSLTEIDEDAAKIDVAYLQEETVYVDGIIDHDYNCGQTYKDHEHTNKNEHNYSEENDIIGNYDDHQVKNDSYSQNSGDDEIAHLAYDTESNDTKLYNYVQDDQEYLNSIVEDLVEGEQVEESLVVEEYIEEVIDQEEEEYF